MKFKKILPTGSPLGWILTAGVVAIAASPTTRKKLRQWAVKGTSAFLTLSDQVKGKVDQFKKTDKQEIDQFDFSNWAPTVNQPQDDTTHMVTNISIAADNEERGVTNKETDVSKPEMALDHQEETERTPADDASKSEIIDETNKEKEDKP